MKTRNSFPDITNKVNYDYLFMVFQIHPKISSASNII